MNAFAGSCHCGAVGFSFRTHRSPGNWSARACQCSFCRAHAALSTSDPSGSIEFLERRSGAFMRYRFGQRTADFLICRHCGVYLGAVLASSSGRFGIINVNALHPIPSTLPAPQPMDYDAETPEQRIARRQQRWSPVVGSTTLATEKP
ncbi:MAG: aldehyde-activating protein [Deltaproteobacteria bacterium]|nr:aldehyde-activating protein [Deltaproteobacteria bacterium]